MSGTLGYVEPGPGPVPPIAGTLSFVVQGGPFLNAGTVVNGGTVTGATASLASHGIVLGYGTKAVGATPAGLLGQMLIAQSGAADPGWFTISGDIAINSGGTAALGSIVAGGTVGDSTHVPIIVYDTKGRITSATSAAVSAGTMSSFVVQGGPFLNGATIVNGQTIDNSVASLTAHGVILAEGTGAAVATAAATAGQVLIGQGDTADPAWETISGDITINSGGTAALGSIVAAGTVGSATEIPVITYDDTGRITSTTTANIGAANLYAVPLAGGLGGTSISSAGDATKGVSFVNSGTIIIASLTASFGSFASGATLVANLSSMTARTGTIASVVGTSVAFVPASTASATNVFVFSPATTLAPGTWYASISCTNQGTAFSTALYYGSTSYVWTPNIRPVGNDGLGFKTQTLATGGPSADIISPPQIILNYSI